MSSFPDRILHCCAHIPLWLIAVLMHCTAVFSTASARAGEWRAAPTTEKCRILVLTDIGGDADDQQSLVRLLLYSNEFDLEGLLATSRMDHGYDTCPELIEQTVAAYGQVRENLLLHAQGYPEAAQLANCIKWGLGDPSKHGLGWDTQASKWIIEVMERPDPRPVWISIWGGARELAQALWSYRDSRDKTEMDKFVAKIRVHAIADQDKWGYWINKNFPELFYIYDGSCGDRACQAFRGQYLTGESSMQDGDWVDVNIRNNHGPLGALYPRNGAGTNGMKEGDTPSFMYMYMNGLMFPEHPEWGGWGGRFALDREGYYSDTRDRLEGGWDERHTVSRWRPAFQRDLQARLDWCTASSFAAANHNPVVIINGDSSRQLLQFTQDTSRPLSLDASASRDPDGSPLNFHWFIYEEASDFSGPPPAMHIQEAKLTLDLPPRFAGAHLHIVLAVTDQGEPPLTSYRRIRLSFNP